MPRSRKNVAPLLESLRAQNRTPTVENPAQSDANNVSTWQNDESTHWTSTHSIDPQQLSRIVNDLFHPERDQTAYVEFLSILQRFSVHDQRDDQLEETVYHLIQAAVSFIRRNAQRFDPEKLTECYRQRHSRRNQSQ